MNRTSESALKPLRNEDHELSASLLGVCVGFEGEDSKGCVTKETATHVYIESKFFTGWMSKEEFANLQNKI